MWQKLKQDVETLMLTPITLRKSIITIDHPRESETIVAPTYTFRLSIRAIPETVELAIDRGSWEPCRVSGTNWWYDWKNYSSGKHQIVVRATLPGGKIFLSSIRRIRVHLPR